MFDFFVVLLVLLLVVFEIKLPKYQIRAKKCFQRKKNLFFSLLHVLAMIQLVLKELFIAFGARP